MPRPADNQPGGGLERGARLAAAGSGVTPPEVLLELAADADGEVRACVARNPRTPPEALARIAAAEDSDYYTLEMVAANPRTPEEVLERLAGFEHHSQWQVRMGVASNPSAPPRLLERLAGDADEWVRFYVRENANTPAEARRRLADEPPPESYQRFLED